VEIEPGVEGLIHLSEMSWSKKVRKPSDVVKAGDQVEVVILGVNTADRRISLGLKQALGDPWDGMAQKHPVGSVVEGSVISLQKFGAFVQIAEGVEGMIHVGDISAEKRINHPQDELKVGQVVKAQVLEIDREKRRLRLGMKQLVPTSLDEYIVEHKEGDVVTGRIVDTSGNRARIELGEGVFGVCRMGDEAAEEAPAASSVDLSALTMKLQERWKGGGAGSKRDSARSGQIRSFRISKLDAATKKIDLELT
jgi:small subunit ribosomal protein S1